MLDKFAAVLDRLIARGWEKPLVVAGGLLLALAYRDLLTVGTRYSLETGVENWLMAPSDRAPAIVLALSGWLFYRRWHRLRALPRRAGPRWLLALLFTASLTAYAWGIHTTTDDLLAVSLIFSAVGLVMLNWGPAGLRAVWLPLAFLAFAIPIPTPLVVTLLWELRLWTAEYTGWMLWLIGLPALVSGDQILRPDQAFQVIEGCSGLRSAETLSMLVVLLVDLFHRRGWHAALLVLSAPAVALGLNGLRVLTLILNPHSTIAAIHSLQGIAILLAGLVLIYLFDGSIAWARAHLGGSPPPNAERPAGGAQPAPGANFSATRALVCLWILSVVTLAASLAIPRWHQPRPPRPPIEAALNDALRDLSWEPVVEDMYFHGRLSYRLAVHRRYETRKGRVDVFIASGSVRERDTTPYGPLNELPGSGWTVLRRDLRKLEVEGQRVQTLVIEKELDRRVVYQWYEGARSLAVESLRSFLGLERSRFTRREPFLVVRLSAPVADLDPETIEAAQAERIGPILVRLASTIADLSAPAPESGSR